jgi:uncharacterized membrane protein YbaN (DUF454 family)
MNWEAISRPLYIGAGWVCVALGVLGIVFPLFPASPFLLVAIWAFSKSSPELAEKIRNHPVAGPTIRAWQDEGVIPLKIKIIAALMMTAMMGFIHYRGAPPWAELLALAAFIGVGVYVFTRPGRARKSE